MEDLDLNKPLWEHHGNASLSITIKNGERVEVTGTGLTTEEACEAVSAYLPVKTYVEWNRKRNNLLGIEPHTRPQEPS